MNEAKPRGPMQAVHALMSEPRVSWGAMLGAVLLAIVITLLATQIVNGANAMPTPPPAPGYGAALTPAQQAERDRRIGDDAYQLCMAPRIDEAGNRTGELCGARVVDEFGRAAELSSKNSMELEFVKPSGATPKTSLAVCKGCLSSLTNLVREIEYAAKRGDAETYDKKRDELKLRIEDAVLTYTQEHSSFQGAKYRVLAIGDLTVPAPL